MRNTWKGTIAGGIVLALSLAAHASDDEPTDLPPIVAYGHFEGGGFAICRGAACAGALAGLEDRNSELSMERTLEPQDEMSRETFCAALKYKRPKDCDANNPPSTPGLDAGWAPNGCGTGGVSNFLVATRHMRSASSRLATHMMRAGGSLGIDRRVTTTSTGP